MGGQYTPIVASIEPEAEKDADPAFVAAVDAKVRAQLLHVLFTAALSCYLDRTNLSFAALEINSKIGLDERAYGVGAGIFFFTCKFSSRSLFSCLV